MEKVRFQHKNKQGLRQLFLLCVLGPQHLARHTCWCPIFPGVPEATQEASQGLLKGAVSAQKALHGDEGVAGRNERKLFP